MTNMYDTKNPDYFANLFRDVGDHESRIAALEAALTALALRVTALEEEE